MSSLKAICFAAILLSSFSTSNLVLAQTDGNNTDVNGNTHKSHSYTTSSNGVITVTTQNRCFPIGENRNDVTDTTAFDIVRINYPQTNSGSLVGIAALSSSKNIATTPFSNGTLTGHYNLATNSSIVRCGISYCKGENCNPEIQLETTNTSVFVNFTTTVCTIEICYGPSTSTDLSISAPSPLMEPGVPYLFKFYLVDSQGKLDEWFFGLEYKPQ